jgi:hypothetical protein
MDALTEAVGKAPGSTKVYWCGKEKSRAIAQQDVSATKMA